jgi:hypothetical protein
MKPITFKEHLFLSESRRSDLTYTEKQVKGNLDRVSTALAGHEAGNMTKLAKRYARLEVSLKNLAEKREALNERLKEDVGNLFDAEDAVLTRVVSTAQFTVTLAKEIKKTTPTKSVDYESIVKALTSLIPEELQSKVDEITQQYTKLIPPKDPVKKVSVSKEITEAFNFSKIKIMISSFVKKITSWASRFDDKLDYLKAKADL